jgi:hypothetical protein
MTSFCPHRVPRTLQGHAHVLRRTIVLLLGSLQLGVGTLGQNPQAPKETIADGYAIHQSIDLGGRIVDTSGSGAMYDTLVNLQSGPRILSQTLDLHAVANSTHRFFDTLSMSNSGYGGDPNNVTTLRVSKDKLYKFQGLFRRDRESFDYNLLDNPLVPAGVTSNSYTFPQVLNSPHLFSTVRRMTDVGLTLFPISKLTFRTAYSQNINQGPSFSSQHNGAEGFFLQNWRNSSDTWLAAVDWKPIAKTTLTFEESVVHYKGNTNWQLAGLNLQLSNGAPVSLGFDNVTVPTCNDGNPPIVTSSTTPPTANPTCSGYLQYFRDAPTRTLFPTEEFRFQSSSIKNIEMNGRVRYTGGNMNLPNYVEFFDGLDNMGKQVFTTTGFANAKRIAVSADYGILWQVSEKISLSEQFDFSNFRQPAISNLSEVDLLGTSMLLPSGPAQPPSTTLAQTFFGMKTLTSTTTVGWDLSSKITVSLGYKHQKRDIRWVMPLSTDALPNGTAYTFPVADNGGILSVVLRPTRQWTINGSIEASFADAGYTQISPRALLHYRIHTRYKPRSWATISGTFNDLERRNDVFLVNHRDHSRSFALAGTLMPNQRYGLDLSYGYSDIFSRTTLCYAATPAPTGPGAGAAPADCGTNTNLGTGYYDAPTQYGLFGIILAPVQQLRANLGYSISAVSGSAEFLNLLQVAGSLQSKYQSPYANIAWTFYPGLALKANWNHYEYEEAGPSGPTLPRNFRSEVYTLAVHYEF